MWKRPLCELAVGFLLGILSESVDSRIFLPAVIFAAAATAVCICREKRYWRGGIRVFLFLLFCFFGRWRYQTETDFRDAYQPELTEGEKLTVQGVLERKEYKNNQYLFYLKDCYAVFSEGILPCNQIIVYAKNDTCSVGEILIAEGTIENWRTAANEGNFDEKAFYESMKIDFKLKNAEILSVYGKPDKFREACDELRERIRQVYEQCLNETDCGIMATMTLGDKSLLDSEVKELYQKAGISHILAISGLHISVIGMSLYRLLRKLRLSYLPAGILSGMVMTGYGIMTGFGTSTARAVIMFLIMLLGQAVGRSYDSLSALGAAAILILWENPFLLTYAGFLFSFAAVLGVVVVGRIVAAAGERRSEGKPEAGAGEKEKGKAKHFVIHVLRACSGTQMGADVKEKETFWRKKLRQLKESILMSYSIQLMVLPLTAFFYFEIPVYAMAVNLLILPLMGMLLFFGLSGGLLGIFTRKGAKLLFFPCHMILAFYQKVCTVSGMLPNASLITGKPEIGRMLLFYLLLAGFSFWMHVRKSRKGFLGIGVLLLCFLLWQPRGGFELDILDVGQGDGCYLHTESGVQIFVDGGSTDVSRVGEYRILPFLKAKGVKRIDYWIVSHTDLDHISGLTEVLEADYPVGCLVFSKEIVRDEAYEALAALAGETQTEILFLKQGEKLHMGEGVLTCLFPGEGDASEDKNAMSLVAEYREGNFSGIFTGDIGVEEENKLAEAGLLSDVFFYKAAHHGSNGSNSSAFLSALTPEIITVSCGEGNIYGHPGAEAVARMEESGGRIFCTMECGQIKIKRERDGSLSVTPWRLTQ